MSSEDPPPGAVPAGASSRRRRRPGRARVGGAPRPRLLELAPPPAPHRPTIRQEGRDGERGAGLVDQAPLGRPGRLAPRQLRAQASPGIRLHPRARHHQELPQVKELSHAQAASSSSATSASNLMRPSRVSPCPPAGVDLHLFQIRGLVCLLAASSSGRRIPSSVTAAQPDCSV
ncbi:hypothetical protein PVAP13_7NG160985 [Panicum virgatum]|uniref:Uncharacterized protein n=1 Tax=Panicum virgatum TaxID=38727 RepID=A0A8T0PV87_PANVG|nr:hypothetical protein PVAP13_7NG160985 [Panicum virgatum]